MNARRIFAIVLRQYYLIRGSAARAIPLFAWVAVNIVLWGFITRYLNKVSGAHINFVATMLGAVLLWEFLTRVMLGVTTAFMEDVWSRNFLNIFATPLTVADYVGGLVLSSILTSAIGLIVMLLLATMAFGLSFFAYGVLLVPFIVVLFLSGIALGILGSAIMLRFGPAAEWFIWPLPAFVSPFVGVFYPLSTLPHWMQAVGHALPPSYVFEGMRAVVLGQAVPPAALLWGFGLAVLYLLLAGWGFRRVYRHAVKTGLIARYSAESIS